MGDIEDIDWLFEDCGKSMIQTNKRKLPPHNNIIECDPKKHEEELAKNMLQWRDCREWARLLRLQGVLGTR